MQGITFGEFFPIWLTLDISFCRLSGKLLSLGWKTLVCELCIAERFC